MIETCLDKNLIRCDQLSGCKNLIAFSETASSLCSEHGKSPYSLIVVDINKMGRINEVYGYAEGNHILRWVALSLETELQTEVYRIGCDEFVAIIPDKSPERNSERGHQIFQRLNQRAAESGLPVPFITVAIIHYSGTEKLRPADYFVHMYCALRCVKLQANRTIKSFDLDQITMEVSPYLMGQLTDNFVTWLLQLGEILDTSLEMAFRDPITQLPNQRVAQEQLKKIILASSLEKKRFTVLLLDGDDLHRYNEISYAAGDEMLRLLGKAIKDTLRPEDFLARWRVGDEFLILLADTTIAQAVEVGERICKNVREVSQQWKLPVTVSIGVAAYPEHGSTSDDLIQAVETANSLAKKRGKNQVTQFKSEASAGNCTV